MNQPFLTSYPHVRQFETNEQLALRRAELLAERRRARARVVRRRWLVVAAAMVALAAGLALRAATA